MPRSTLMDQSHDCRGAQSRIAKFVRRHDAMLQRGLAWPTTRRLLRLQREQSLKIYCGPLGTSLLVPRLPLGRQTTRALVCRMIVAGRRKLLGTGLTMMWHRIE